MTTAFVLGNGTSRQIIDVSLLKNFGPIYGCNALYREFVPDVLVATDRPIATTIQESGYALKHRFHTRRPIESWGARPVPHEYFGFSSGPIAVSLAAQDGHRQVYMLGFDMGPTSDNKINNIYAGTQHYRPKDAPPTYTGNWIKQLVKIMENHKNCKFTRVIGSTTALIKELEALSNVRHVDIDTFLDRINNKKDL